MNEFLNVFLKERRGLPSRREVDFSIKLELGTTLISKTPYRTTLAKLKHMTLEGSVLFIKKKDEFMCLCIDYKEINSHTTNRRPI